MEDYPLFKIECVPSSGLDYSAYPFEVFFATEEAVFDFMDIVPPKYLAKHYDRAANGRWELTCEIQGWRECE